MGIEEKKRRISKKIIRSAVDLMGREGYDQVSMRTVAKQAEIGEATIYRYFPNKIDIVYGYYDSITDEVVDHLSEIDGFADFSFAEQLQSVLFAHFDAYQSDEAFVKETQKALNGQLLQTTNQARVLKNRVMEIVEELLNAAVDAGEFEEPPMKALICSSIVDTSVGIAIYWSNDKSPKKENTMQLVDKSVAVVDGLLKSNVLGGFADIAQFLFRQHVVSWLTTTDRRSFDFASIKKQFTGPSV